MTNKKKILFILNIIIPLFVGLLIYVFLKQGTYINVFLKKYGISPYIAVSDNLLFSIVKNWLCDFLWAYSLLFSINFALKKVKNSILLSAAITLFLGIALELLQKIGLMGGIFDFLDIAAESCAVLLAIIIIKGVEKNEKY